MRYYLSSHITFCFHDDQPVFLDRRNDRYFRLSAKVCGAFRTLLADGPEPPSAALKGLLSRGVLVDDAKSGGPIKAASIFVPSASVLEDIPSDFRVSISLFPAVILAFTGVIIDLKFRTFDEVLRVRQNRRPDPQAREGVHEIRRLARSFDALRRSVPITPICLRDSLALLDFLRTRGYDANLVFGVKLHPFEAHCWVQTADVLLNEIDERTRLYTPILVV